MPLQPQHSPQAILEQLEQLADPAYRDFAASLIPGGMPMLGVRLPKLRTLARRLARDDWRQYILAAPPARWMEQIMLQGLVLGYAADASLSERLRHLENLLPHLNNWSLCDSCCTTYRFARDHRDALWPWLIERACSSREYEARFGIVMLLFHYLPERAWAKRIAELLPQLNAKGMYATMAAAWCTCELYLIHPDLAAPLLHSGSLPEPTRLAALRKIRESRRAPRSHS